MILYLITVMVVVEVVVVAPPQNLKLGGRRIGSPLLGSDQLSL